MKNREGNRFWFVLGEGVTKYDFHGTQKCPSKLRKNTSLTFVQHIPLDSWRKASHHNKWVLDTSDERAFLTVAASLSRRRLSRVGEMMNTLQISWCLVHQIPMGSFLLLAPKLGAVVPAPVSLSTSPADVVGSFVAIACGRCVCFVWLMILTLFGGGGLT